MSKFVSTAIDEIKAITFGEEWAFERVLADYDAYIDTLVTNRSGRTSNEFDDDAKLYLQYRLIKALANFKILPTDKPCN